jgi:hypothetical protein
MLEHIGSGYEDLVDDLTLANCSAWQQYTLAGVGSTDDGGKYFLIDDTDPSDPVVTLGSRTKFLRQYFAYVRPGATRVDATSNQAEVEPVAFTNPEGTNVVVVKADEASTCYIQGLPAGSYGITYTTSTAYNVSLSDVTLIQGGFISVSIPSSGVLTVRELWRAPVVDFYPSYSDVDLYEGYDMNFSATPSGVDPSELTFEWSLDGNAVATDATWFLYIADYASAGDHELTITVTDPRGPNLSTSFTWYVTVYNVNRAPEVTASFPEASMEVNETLDGSMIYSVEVTDPDDDVLTYIWYVNSMEVAQGPESSYTFNYDFSSSGYHYIQVTVTDDIDSVYVYWNLQINEVNRPPSVLSREPGETVSVDEVDYGYLELSVQVWDPDGDYISYEWEMDGETLYGARYASYTFQYSHDSAGTYVVRVVASDYDHQVEVAWLITVVDVNVAPTITYTYPYYTPSYYETENGTVELSVTAYDPEGDELFYTWYVDDVLAPGESGSSFNFTFDFDSAGEHLVNVTVGDGTNQTSWSWTVQIYDTNRPPVAEGGVPEGDFETFNQVPRVLEVLAIDLDGDNLTYQWYINGSYIYDAENATYELVPDGDFIGTLQVMVYVYDGRGGSDFHYWNVTVVGGPGGGPRHRQHTIPGDGPGSGGLGAGLPRRLRERRCLGPSGVPTTASTRPSIQHDSDRCHGRQERYSYHGGPWEVVDVVVGELCGDVAHGDRGVRPVPGPVHQGHIEDVLPLLQDQLDTVRPVGRDGNGLADDRKGRTHLGLPPHHEVSLLEDVAIVGMYYVQDRRGGIPAHLEDEMDLVPGHIGDPQVQLPKALFEGDLKDLLARLDLVGLVGLVNDTARLVDVDHDGRVGCVREDL